MRDHVVMRMVVPLSMVVVMLAVAVIVSAAAVVFEALCEHRPREAVPMHVGPRRARLVVAEIDGGRLAFREDGVGDGYVCILADDRGSLSHAGLVPWRAFPFKPRPRHKT